MSFLKAFTRAADHNSKSDKKKSFKITYKKMNGRTVKRKIDPHNIRGNLVVAWDHKRKAIRSFKIDKVKSMEKLSFLGFGKSKEYKKLDKEQPDRYDRDNLYGGYMYQGDDHPDNAWMKTDPSAIALREDYIKNKNNKPGYHGKFEKKSFWNGFDKQASLSDNLTHGAELAGLGILAAPSIKHLATGKDMSEGNKSKTELAGLGVLAAPSAYHIGKKLLGK